MAYFAVGSLGAYDGSHDSFKAGSLDDTFFKPVATAIPDPSPSDIPPQVFEPVTGAQAAAINASIPISSAPNPAAQPFSLAAVGPVDQARAQACLAMAAYYEAATQGDIGEAAVAQVVLNRVRNTRFPKTVCGVVFQGSTLPTGCQFTFTCDGSLNRRPDPIGWKRANEVASRALNGYVEPLVGEATHYHTIWVVPYWQSSVDKVAQIGAHIFYRWSGSAGSARAFAGAYEGAEPLPPHVPGIDLELGTVAPLETRIVGVVVAQPEPAPISKGLVMTTDAKGGRAPAATLATPVLPSRLETNPATPQLQDYADTNRHLAIPQSW